MDISIIEGDVPLQKKKQNIHMGGVGGVDEEIVGEGFRRNQLYDRLNHSYKSC
jgi:hypothetical protein